MPRSRPPLKGMELRKVESAEHQFIFQVLIRGRTVGCVRWDAVSGVYRYNRLHGSSSAPMHHHGNDLEGVLRWIAHRP